MYEDEGDEGQRDEDEVIGAEEPKDEWTEAEDYEGERNEDERRVGATSAGERVRRQRERLLRGQENLEKKRRRGNEPEDEMGERAKGEEESRDYEKSFTPSF